MDFVFSNVRIIRKDGVTDACDVEVNNGKVVRIGRSSKNNKLECSGGYLMPGCVDMHAHLRDPGDNPENIISGSRAALAGGITSLVAMANTDPICDNDEVYEYIINKSREKSYCRIIQAVAGTEGLSGKMTTSEKLMRKSGLVSDDGVSVDDDNIFMNLMEKIAKWDLIYLSHAEDRVLRGRGVINCGKASRDMGLSCISNQVEDQRTERDIKTAMTTGAHIHFCHVSTAGALELIRQYKKKGVKVSCEVTPHHFTLSDHDINYDNSDYKMNPPLRSPDDLAAVIQAIKDGTVDVISTDHAPHPEDSKTGGFTHASFGIIGFETMLPLAVDVLHREHGVSLEKIYTLIYQRPAEILKLETGEIKEGFSGDMTMFRREDWTYSGKKIISACKNTPFKGRTFHTRVIYTVAGGRLFNCERGEWFAVDKK